MAPALKSADQLSAFKVSRGLFQGVKNIRARNTVIRAVQAARKENVTASDQLERQFETTRDYRDRVLSTKYKVKAAEKDVHSAFGQLVAFNSRLTH